MHFFKFQGAGNDFVIVDNRPEKLLLNQSAIQTLCHRRFGIGADGFMMIESSDLADFKLVYFNSNGMPGSLCGNGSRCAVAFAHRFIAEKQTHTFEAYDGIHKAEILSYIGQTFLVALEMKDVCTIEPYHSDWVLNTGSPHLVRQVQQLNYVDVENVGRGIRNMPEFQEKGINVNFVEVLKSSHIAVRTYERGVEAETYSCGTGVTAAAIAQARTRKDGMFNIQVDTPGGTLWVSFEKRNGSYVNIVLKGPAVLVFEGQIQYESLPKH